MLERAQILAGYAEVRSTRARLKTRADLQAHQRRLWARLQRALRRVPAFADPSGERFPEVDAAAVRADFARRNALGLDLQAAARAADSAEAGGDARLPGNIAAGWSTGTSGARGLFLASPAERRRYVGAALATLLPGPILDPWRIALVLRADSALYRDVSGAGRFQFRFLGLDAPDKAATLARFDPHVLIAPAHVLHDLAAQGARWPSLRRALAAAEPLGAAERPWIAARLGAPVDPLYQATEGFLGAPCRHGTLHLNEDWLIVERRPLDRRGRFQPVVTDLARTTQPVVRQRLDDILLARGPCPCGSPLLAVERVEGRLGDAWRFGDATVFPGEVEAEVDAVLGPEPRWRARQLAADAVAVEVEHEAFIGPVRSAVATLLADHGVAAACAVEVGPVRLEGPKRRRVRGLG